MSLFPIFLKLQDRPCLVVGAGEIAESKIHSLLTAGARVTVVAPEAKPGLIALADAGCLPGTSASMWLTIWTRCFWLWLRRIR